MKQQRLFRIILALFVVALSSASAVHEVLHHDAPSAADSRTITSPSVHADHSGDCEFCAKGPTTSTEASTVILACFSHPEVTAPCESFVSIPRATISLLTLRGPPTA